MLLNLNFLLQVSECDLGDEMTVTCCALSTGIKLYDIDTSTPATEINITITVIFSYELLFFLQKELNFLIF